MYQALYRKYRPQTFDDVSGQGAVTQTLKSQIATGKLSHAYLFTGSRGTGKTTCAKILAKAVNCLDPRDGNPCNCCDACRAIDSGACMDVLEIDAASNNGVDNVRDLRDDAIYTPSQVKMRVYIIDEVHMLSISAFNALLKIIEEPPEHLLFILATTELHKVPATILSRCQRFSFRRISQEDIAARLQYVAYQEKIDLEESAARTLARMADGALRDALSLLDQCASATAGELNAQSVYACLGIAGEQTCGEMMGYIADKDTASCLELFNRLYASGKDIAALLDELSCLSRDLLILKTAPKAGLTMLSGIADETQTKALADRFSAGELLRIIEVIQATLSGFTRSESRRIDGELCLMTLCQPQLQLDVQGINARLTRLEEDLQNLDRTQVAPVKKSPAAAPKPVETPKASPAKQETSQTVPEQKPAAAPAPIGFWADVASGVRKELSPMVGSYFVVSDTALITGTLEGDTLTLQCKDTFAFNMVNKPDVLAVVERKASAVLKRAVAVKIVDLTAQPQKSDRMERLIDFGKAHSDIVHLKDR